MVPSCPPVTRPIFHEKAKSEKYVSCDSGDEDDHFIAASRKKQRFSFSDMCSSFF